jgi:superfamily I DNA/RNA helicase
LRRARKVALVNLLDQLGLALALDPSSTSKEDALFRDITRPYTLGRYSDCLDMYASEVAGGAEGAPDLDEVIARLGGRALMDRLRAERPVDERYAGSVDRLRMLVAASAGDTVAEQIGNMLCRVALSTSAEAETDPHRINLLTLHSTKGLEFSRVYIIGAENQVLPGWRAIQEERTEEIQEGRRLLYVGMTRARHRLVLTHAEQRGGYRAQGNLFLTEAGLVLEDPGIPSALEVPVISE